MNSPVTKILSLSIILIILFTGSSYGQHLYGERHYFDTQSTTTATGEYIYNLNQSSATTYGLGFVVNSTTRLHLWKDEFRSSVYAEFTEDARVRKGFRVDGSMLLIGDLDIQGTISSFSMVEDGDITNLNVLRGTNDLSFEGSPTSGTNMYINAAGLIGMGTSSPNSQLHIDGGENDGSTAALTITNGGSEMLLDGNEIDATASPLYLQRNSTYDVSAVGGGEGGNFGIGTWTPSEKLHLVGNFRIDNGDIMSHGSLTFKPDIDVTGDDEIVFYNNVEEETLRIHTDGNVGIGVAAPTQKLEVDGTVKATSFVTSTASFPDYVFSNSYKKLSLNNLDQYIQANKHLPNMPAEAEVVANGLDVADVVIKSVENIETIYLHLIEMNKKLDLLQQENEALKAQLNK
ncbi:hypothetical protein [Reichenbachiella sp.]|uniref:hypothetical protein n=1 Tax=Reichenbachiella sp. TaxID=2184521 RepID=UPI003BB1032B